jgi:hypothetical protein
MTRKDYELIAEVLASLSADTRYEIDEVAEAFADRLAETNERFDKVRFLRASGVPEVLIAQIVDPL